MWQVVRRALRRLANLSRWSAIERDLRDEVEAHLDMAAAEHRRRGLSAEDARRLALREFGGDRWLEASRSARGVPWLQDVGRDARYAIRTFIRRRGFALAVVAVMALAVGATTAVYSVIRGVLLNPLPYAEPERLYTLLESNSAGGQRQLSYPTFREVADAVGAEAELAYVRGDGLVVRGDDGTMNLLAGFASPNFFELMGVAARAGRTFGRDDGAASVAVLSWRMAARVFGAAQSAVGQSLVTADGSFTVIGIMPPGFVYPAWADLWLPIEAMPATMAFALEQRDLHVDSDVVVRLPPGTPLNRLATLLSGPITRASDLYPEPGGRFDSALLTPLSERVLGFPAPRLWPMLGAATLLLVLASINIAGIMLARGIARRGEFAVRVALGAGRSRLVRQLMTESVLLAIAGGALGVLLAYVAVLEVKRGALDLLPRLEEVTVDGGVLLFALAVTLLSAAWFGAVPALRATAGVAARAMRAATRSATGDRPTSLLRSGLVVAQIALAIVLLVGASLLVRTQRALLQLDLGFEPSGLVALAVEPPERYDNDDARLGLYERLRSALERVPGVESAVLANHIPLTQAMMVTGVQTEREVAPDDNTIAVFRAVSAKYLPTIGATLARGRFLTEDDARGTAVVVNEALARREWGDANPVGRPITVFRSAQGAANFGEPLPSYVAGVVQDIREQGPDQDVQPTVYVPLERNVWPRISVVVKAMLPSNALLSSLRAAVHDVDPGIPTAGPHPWNEFQSLDAIFASGLQARRLTMMLLGAFAAAAVVLSLTGLFATLAFVVTQRTREIGVRMALGATRRDAARLVVRQSAVLVCLGIVIGLGAAIPATRVLEASLFGVERVNVAGYAITCAFFLATAALAAFLPARRAASIDPMTALRTE